MSDSNPYTRIIFAGAGASKAVNPKHYPTTVEFFERLPTKITRAKLFAEAVEFLKTDDPLGVIDVELVLGVLSELAAFAGATGARRSLAGWLLEQNRIGKLLKTQQNFTPFARALSDLSTLIDQLVRSIHILVYDLYARAPTSDELSPNWLALLRGVFIDPRPTEVFTTNYDINIETALTLLKDEGLPTRVETGRQTKVYSELDYESWIPDRRQRPGAPGLLTKLHGSVDWTRGPRDVVYVGDPTYKGSDEKQVILYPGFKGAPKSQPFIQFHEHLSRELTRADSILFIGFAFRDEQISRSLEQLTRPNCRIAVIDPRENFGKLPYQPDRFEHIKESFDTASVTRALEYLRWS
jgi:hypothetical protein